MPRRKAFDGPAQHSRSRTGCLACKRRRVKCDGASPICANCQRMGLECSRSIALKWQSEYEANGLAFGREGVWSKQGPKRHNADVLGSSEPHWVGFPQIRPYSFVKYGIAIDQTVLCNSRSYTALSPRPAKISGLNLERPLRLLPTMDPAVHASIMTYYVEQFCPITTLDQHATSPFLAAVLPRLPISSPMVLDAILALAARHGATNHNNWAITAAKLESRAVRALHNRLADSTALQVAHDAEIHLVIMMLCIYEVVNKCDQRWVVHLKGARDIARVRRALTRGRPAGMDDLLTFVDCFFAFQDAMGRTACRKEALYEVSYWNAEDDRIDPWMCCSPSLISILCSAVDLSRARQTLPQEMFSLEARTLHCRLNALQQYTDPPGEVNLERFAAVKHCGGRILLHCALGNATPSTRLVRKLVTELLTRLDWFVDKGLGARMIWPAFIAAVELDPFDDDYSCEISGFHCPSGRAFILKALDCHERRCIGNVARARQVICEIWQARDEAMEVPVEAGPMNDWEVFVAPRTNNLSLA